MTTARRSVFGALAFAVVSTAGACSDSLAPADISGVYALESREGVRLPTLIHEGDAADIFLMSETLILRADRSGLRAVVQEYRRIGGDTETATWERELSFDIVDGRIEIAMICGPLELCTPPPHLVLYPFERGLRTLTLPGAVPALSYVRILLIDIDDVP